YNNLMALTSHLTVYSRIFRQDFVLSCTDCMNRKRPDKHVSQSCWIDEVYWVVEDVAVEVCVAAGEEDGILGGPPSGLRVVVSGAESDQAGFPVVESAGESEGLEAGVGVENDIAKFIITHSLDNRACACVHNESWTSKMIAQDPIQDSAPNHSTRHES